MDTQATEVVEQVEAQAETTEQVTTEIDYKAEYEKLTQLTEKQKSEIAGLDKKVGEQTNLYRELLKKSETEAETKAREAEEKAALEQKRLDELTTRESKAIAMENALNVKLKAVELGLKDDLETIQQLGINTVEGVELYKARIDQITIKTKESTVETIEKSRTGNREILTGNTEASRFPNAIEKAFK